jgi:hypothetical protein
VKPVPRTLLGIATIFFFGEILTILYDLMQLDELNPNTTLVSKKILYNRKVNDSRAETRFFRKPLSLFLFSGTTWRCDQ